MTTPTNALVLTLPNSDELTLDDHQIFERGGFTVKAFKAFMAKFSNWTPAQVGLLTVTEMQAVLVQILTQLRNNAVPK